MSRWLTALALLLPLVGLGAGIARQEAALDGATRWVIPIEGYDPRDPLRGQYLQFGYAWQTQGDAGRCATPAGCVLCLARRDGEVVATVAGPETRCPDRVDPRLSRIEIRPGFAPDQRPAFTARLFVSEARAPGLEAKLAEGPMAVVARLASDGRLIPDRVIPAR
ncbi:MAG: GDYXXLXY domain-containing protein [Sphingomonadaceae bacterium]